jgi:hypothetical protein
MLTTARSSHFWSTAKQDDEHYWLCLLAFGVLQDYDCYRKIIGWHMMASDKLLSWASFSGTAAGLFSLLYHHCVSVKSWISRAYLDTNATDKLFTIAGRDFWQKGRFGWLQSHKLSTDYTTVRSHGTIRVDPMPWDHGNASHNTDLSSMWMTKVQGLHQWLLAINNHPREVMESHYSLKFLGTVPSLLIK